jgi:hypothetical protein
MKALFLTLALSLAALTGCATAPHEAFSKAHESASKRGIAEAESAGKAREVEARASVSAANACESDLCRVAIMGYANMRQMMAKQVESVAPNIVAPVDPLLALGAKLIDKGADVILGKFGLDGKLSDNSRTISAGDSDLAKQINRSNTPVNPFVTPTQ